MYRILLIVLLLSFSGKKENVSAWIRINQLGYTPSGVKVAVWCSKDRVTYKDISVGRCENKKICLFRFRRESIWRLWPFKQTYRLNFSSFKKPGRYYLQAGGVKSPEFEIGDDVYKGSG